MDDAPSEGPRMLSVPDNPRLDWSRVAGERSKWRSEADEVPRAQSTDSAWLERKCAPNSKLEDVEV